MSASVWEPGANLVVVDAESTNLSQVFIATLAQTGFTLTEFSYTVGTGSLAVYRGGQRLILGTDWEETSGTNITLLGVSLEVGEVIEVVAVLGSASVSANASAQSAANAAQSAIDAANAAASLDTSNFMQKANNLSDLASASTARTNLGLGSAATQASAAFASSGTVTGNGNTMATGRLLGRTTASTGAIEEISVGSGLALASGELSATYAGPALSTAQATTSGTYKDFSIPAGAKRISVILGGVSTGAATNLLVQLASGGALETTGYTSTAQSSGSSATSTAGFLCTYTNSSTNAVTGIIDLIKLDGNTWIEKGEAASPANTVSSSVGSKTLAGLLDRVRITSVGGDTFDLGSVNILYE